MNKRVLEASSSNEPFQDIFLPSKRRELDPTIDNDDPVIAKINNEISTMKDSNDVGSKIRGCVSLWKLASDPCSSKVLATTNVVPYILATMKDNIDHVAYITVGFNTLFRVLSCDDNAKSAVNHGALPLILEIIRKHISNGFICKRGCEIIQSMACDIGSFDDITCILAILNTHSVDGDVQFAAFALLGALKPAEFAPQWVSAVTGQVIDALRRSQADVPVQWKGFALLRKLTRNSVGPHTIIMKGGLEVILATLRQHFSYESICERGFQILNSLVALPHIAIEVASQGGLTTTIAALRRHTNNFAIQSYGCRLLFNVLNLSGIPHPHMKGGVECVLTAMRNHPYDLDIQKYTCGILAILAVEGLTELARGYVSLQYFEEGYRTLIVIEGGVNLILSAMKIHLVSDNINRFACKILSQLDMLKEVCRPKVIEVIDCVLCAMRVHQHKRSLQAFACELLNFLADFDYYNYEIRARGGRACVKTAVFSVNLEQRTLLRKLSRKWNPTSYKQINFTNPHNITDLSLNNNNNYINNNNNRYRTCDNNEFCSTYQPPHSYEYSSGKPNLHCNSDFDTTLSNFTSFGNDIPPYKHSNTNNDNYTNDDDDIDDATTTTTTTSPTDTFGDEMEVDLPPLPSL